MYLNDINIRDPYVLVYNNMYYLYGTRASTCWGKAEGFDCYISRDLVNWEGPHEVFKRPVGFWADQNFWAPECIDYRGRIYMITTFGTQGRKGVQILSADTPVGPFEPITDNVITPKDWMCLDGTIYFEDGKPYLIFSHSFEDSQDGEMCALELSDDLKTAKSDVRILFNAKESPWAKPVPFAEKEFGLKCEVYFTDGPTAYRLKNGKLIIVWSSWGKSGYTVGEAVSESGSITGPWYHHEKTVFDENGGHGMLFKALDGQLFFAIHYPNDLYKEHPCFIKAYESEDMIVLSMNSHIL